MIIKNHMMYYANGDAVEYVQTPNKSGTVNPLYLIIHYTAGTSFDGAINWFSNPRAKASANIVIGRDGRVVQMVPLNRKAWHAGRSSWGQLSSMNKYSIGIELVNAGKLQQRTDGAWINWSNAVIPDEEVVILTHKNESREAGWQIYAEQQISTAIEVAVALHDKYEFTDILGHDDVAPNRKVDPGPAFPLISFASNVLGRNEGERREVVNAEEVF